MKQFSKDMTEFIYTKLDFYLLISFIIVLLQSLKESSPNMSIIYTHFIST